MLHGISTSDRLWRVKHNAGAEGLGVVLTVEAIILRIAVFEDAPVEFLGYWSVHSGIDLDLGIC